MAFPTTFLDLQNSVIAKLRLDATADRPRVKDWINQAYAAVCEETEATQTSATLALTPNVPSYTLATAILRIHEITAAPATSPTGYGPPLKSVSLDEILEMRQTQSAVVTTGGTSTHYALVGLNELEVYPTPSAADVLLMYYTYLPTVLSADGDVPVVQEPWAKLLEYGALVEGAQFLRDDLLTYYEGKFSNLYARFTRHLNRRQGGPPMQLRVGSARTFRPARDVDVGV